MRTADEIIDRMKASTSCLGFDREVMLPYLTFAQARPFLKADASEADWPADWGQPEKLTREATLAEMADYMSFAWDKAQNHRGISAGRSIEKMETWLWLLGDDATLAEVEAAGYAQYGAPKLKVICDRYGFTVPDDEDLARMIVGDPCGQCDCGCGR
jgi:hypothetical protein